MNELEEFLAKEYKSEYCIFTGNGTTAMYLFFKAINKKEKKVLYPSITCTNPVNAAIYAGYDVDFCDVNLEDFTMDLNALEEKLATNEFGVIVPTHIFGYVYNRMEVKEICDRYNVVILEDSAQTTTVGSANASITSFGHTKIFETQNGGGAIFTNEYELYNKIIIEKKKIRIKPNNYHLLFDEYRKKYYSIIKSNISEKEINEKMLDLQMNSKNTFIFDLESNDEIYSIIQNKNKLLSDRRIKSLIYDDLLENINIKKVKLKEEYKGIWRYTFLYFGNRDLLLEKVREKGIDISSWYPALNNIYKNKTYTNSRKVEKYIVNLWIDGTHSEKQIRNEIKEINKIIKEIDYEY